MYWDATPACQNSDCSDVVWPSNCTQLFNGYSKNVRWIQGETITQFLGSSSTPETFEVAID